MLETSSSALRLQVLKKSRMCSIGLSPLSGRPLVGAARSTMMTYGGSSWSPLAAVHRAAYWFSGCAPGAASGPICLVPHFAASGCCCCCGGGGGACGGDRGSAAGPGAGAAAGGGAGVMVSLPSMAGYERLMR